MLENLSSNVLQKAAHLKAKIEALTHEFKQLIEGAGGVSLSITVGRPPGKKGMSAAGRARIAAAQNARWAKVNKGKTDGVPAKKGKRMMSPAAKKKLAAIAKARWAKVRAAGRNTL